MAKLIDLSGMRFGRLLIIGRAKSSYQTMWTAQCDCGAITTVSSPNVRRGGTRSCGCLSREIASERQRQRNFIHGMTGTPTWHSWSGMLGRCENPNNAGFDNYGGRGISVCARWHEFENFLADMGQKPVGMSIERINTNGNYEPGNCRWATTLEQNRNRRSVILVTARGETKCVTEWAAIQGLPAGRVFQRIYAGQSPAAALELEEQ